MNIPEGELKGPPETERKGDLPLTRQQQILQALRKARQFLAERKFALARQAIEEGLKISPRHPLLRTRLADILFQQGNDREALKILNQLLEEKPALHYARFLRGKILQSRGKFEQAAEDYFRSLRNRPEDRFVLQRLLPILIRLKQGQPFRELIQTYRNRFHDPFLFVEFEVQWLLSEGKQHQALQLARQYFLHTPQADARQVLELFRTLMSQWEERPSRLYEIFRQANSALPRLEAIPLLELDARYSIERGRWKEALPLLERILQQRPEDSFWRKQKAFLLIKQNQPRKAQSLLEELFLENPSDVYVRASLQRLLVKTGQLARWRWLLREALRRHPRQTALFGLLRKSRYFSDWLADLEISYASFLQQVAHLELPGEVFPAPDFDRLPYYALESFIIWLVQTRQIPTPRHLWDFLQQKRAGRSGPSFSFQQMQRAYGPWLFSLQFYLLTRQLRTYPLRYVPARFQREKIALYISIHNTELALDVTAFFHPGQSIRKRGIKTKTGYRWRISPSPPPASSLHGIPFYQPEQFQALLEQLEAFVNQTSAS